MQNFPPLDFTKNLWVFLISAQIRLNLISQELSNQLLIFSHNRLWYVLKYTTVFLFVYDKIYQIDIFTSIPFPFSASKAPLCSFSLHQTANTIDVIITLSTYREEIIDAVFHVTSLAPIIHPQFQGFLLYWDYGSVGCGKLFLHSQTIIPLFSLNSMVIYRKSFLSASPTFH